MLCEVLPYGYHFWKK